METGEIRLQWKSRSYRMQWEERPDRVYHQTFSRNAVCSMHSHPAYHLLLVTEGSRSVNIEGYPPINLPVNTLLLINPGITHQFTFGQSDVSVSNPLIWVFKDDDGNVITEPLQKLVGIDNSDEPYVMRVLFPDQASEFLRLHREMERYFWNTPDYIRSAKQFALFMLGVELLFKWSWNKVQETADNAAVFKEKIYSLIEINYFKENFTSAAVARELDRSLHYLNTIMLKETGSGIARHLLNRRLAAARTQLETTNIPAKNIAYGCGFSSESYFSAVFRREHNMTPGEYRKMYNSATREQPTFNPLIKTTKSKRKKQQKR